MQLVLGKRYRSVTCETEVIAVRVPDGDMDLRCGGEPMVAADESTQGASQPIVAGLDGGSVIGKRYASPEGDLELLCCKAGAGTLSAGNTPLPLRQAKPLPSSD
ncbi:hypothetical protein [Nocardia sp. CA-120079]|uniref:hypothetical protein n=1 Tax=Nocardia sp. CA-120079 TaxID=3239974 RepID=UPI003D99A72E